MNRGFKHVLHVSARFNADGFDLGTFVADHHLLLPFTLNEDQAVDVIAAAFVGLKTFNLNRYGVRQFRAKETHQFFTDDLRGHKALRTIGDVIFREVMNRFRQMFAHDACDGIDVQTGLGRQRDDIKEVHLASQPLQVRQQIGFFLHVVHFVDRKDHRRFTVAQFVQHHFVVRRPAGAFHHENHQLYVANRAARRLVHQAVDGALLFHVQARGINVDRLIGAFRVDTDDAVTRGLRLTGSNGNFLPKQIIQQGRFANVRTSDDGNKPAIRFFFAHSSSSIFNACSAAACSALRRLEPVPTTGSLRPLTWQWMVNS
ncbi:hypothetical protein EcWSU1_03379 [Enterobacter ludwigii]|uniref:Uncharacterized protein n=1 Tax=Enterobacter ludwigii TaxID=299767 RepID=G8LNB8_9ENTR|nr:hypothetical protein EcWSU1_03379 [Enterobacter ludwigii]